MYIYILHGVHFIAYILYMYICIFVFKCIKIRNAAITFYFCLENRFHKHHGEITIVMQSHFE